MPYTASDGRTVYYYCEAELESITDLKPIVKQTQEFAEILKEVAGGNFKDDEFPHTDESIGDFNSLLDVADPELAKEVQGWRNNGWNGSATWIRVADLCQRQYGGTNTACFNCGDIGKTVARNDIQQGSTGDCWFLCSVASVAMVSELIEFVVPEDNQTNDAGVYHFRFWYEGAWVDIVVDDYIPCIVFTDNCNTVGSNFYPNNGKAEFWPMLLEKAYAKLYGSYSNIASNVPMYALENLIGGFGICLTIGQDLPADAYEQILKWFDKDCIVCAGTNSSNKGVVGDHAYSVTGARIITLNDGSQAKLLRLRNPWGRHEWTGDWSDYSSHWNDVSQAQKDEIGFVQNDDGEFWMSYHDFLKYYQDVSACFYFNPNSFNQPGSKFQFAQFNSQWSTAQNTAGGFEIPQDNPHFTVEVSSDSGGECLLIFGTLEIAKIYTKMSDNSFFCIRLFSVPSGASNFDATFFNNATEIYAPGQTQCSGGNGCRSYSIFSHLAPGKYLIIPTTLNAGFDKKICVRVYNEGKSQAEAVAPSAGAGRAGSRSRSNSGQSAASGSRSRSASGSSTGGGSS